MDRQNVFVSAVIYIYDCEDTIKKFISQMYNELSSSFNKFEIICIDDGSKDKSVDILKEVSETFQHTVVNIIHMGKHNGVELSMKAGIDLAIGDFIYEFDKTTYGLDFNLIKTAFLDIQNGYDIINCCTSSPNKMTSRIFYRVFNHYSKMENSIGGVIFRIISRRAVNRTYSMNVITPYRKAVYANCGLKSKNLYYSEEILMERDGGFNADRCTTAVNALLLFTNVGYKFSFYCTLFMIIFSLIVLVYTTIIYLTGKPVAGWTPIMLFMSFSFLGLFIIMTILIKYIDLLLNLNFKKQEYIIEDIEKINK